MSWGLLGWGTPRPGWLVSWGSPGPGYAASGVSWGLLDWGTPRPGCPGDSWTGVRRVRGVWLLAGVLGAPGLGYAASVVAARRIPPQLAAKPAGAGQGRHLDRYPIQNRWGTYGDG